MSRRRTDREPLPGRRVLTSAQGLIELVGDPDRPESFTLVVEGTPQSHVDLHDPTYLEFEYVRWLGHLVDLVGDGARLPISVLHLGGGAWTLARYVAATRPGSRQRVVEIDPQLTDFVRECLPAPGSGIRVRIGDAREVLAGLRPGSVDLIVVDVFSGARIPPHLTSLEFVRQAARVLRPHGTYAANLADGPPLTFARGQVATVDSVFASTAVVGSSHVLRGRGFGNLLVVGVDPHPDGAGTTIRPDRAERWTDLGRKTAQDPFRARVVTGQDLTRFIAGARVVTDATAVLSPSPPTFL